MITTQTAELLQHLKEAKVSESDTDWLDHVPGEDVVTAIRDAYPLTFQERRFKGKWEVSLARRVRAEVVGRVLRHAKFVSLSLLPYYSGCILLSLENDRLTGISRVSRIAFRPVRKPVPGLELTSSRGVKLEKSVDGWSVKPLLKRRVTLSEEFLRQRGWSLDHFGLLLNLPAHGK